MPTESTIGRLLLENALPEEARHPIGPLNKKGTSRLVETLAALGPDKYRQTIKRLTEVATQAGYESGGYSFGPEDMLPGPRGQALRNEFRQRVADVMANTSLTPKMRNAELVKVSAEYSGKLSETIYAEHLANRNPLALQVESGAKGKAENLKALVAGDTLYADQNYEPIPVPITRSFAEGLSPVQYFAGTFGARQSIGLTKLGTAQGGWLAKRIANLAHRLVVVDRDGPEPKPDAHPTGLPVSIDDPDSENAFLAHPAGGYPRNTHLTSDVLGDLRKKGVDKLIVRSPMVGGPADGGVYGLDVGVRERGGVAPRGDHVGRAASDALSEPITQTIIGCLVVGTKVRMADWSVKNIEDVRVNDEVIGADESGTTFPVRVTCTFDNGVRECIRTVFYVDDQLGAVVLESTPDHKVLVDAGKRFKQSPVGDSTASVVVIRDNQLGLGTLDTQTPMGRQQTYDIEVDCPSHLFLLANGLIVSNSKHGGGVVGATKAQEGFPVLERLFAVPANYPGGITHSQKDGLVTMVRPAPQGGHYVHVDGEEHYVPPALKVAVQAGDKVEAGDPLSDGILNPSEVVHHKGIGEARRQFVEAFREVAKANGFRADRRNIELVTRGYIDHVRMDQEHGEYAPGEIASYTAIAHDYEPRDGHVRGTPKDLLGQYLERPVLHYSIGTRITPSVVRMLGEHAIDTVTAHPKPPPFTPVLVRSNDNLSHDRDWMTQGLGSGNEKNLLHSLARGAVSDPAGTSFVPALAEGVNFGSPAFKSTGWKLPPAALK